MSEAKKSIRRFIETIDKNGKVAWARKTRFIPKPDGSVRRLVTRKDGTVEKDEIIPAALVAEARAKTGLSQDKFAALLGISARTLRDWAARKLLRIAAKHPEVLREVA